MGFGLLVVKSRLADLKSLPGLRLRCSPWKRFLYLSGGKQTKATAVGISSNQKAGRNAYPWDDDIPGQKPVSLASVSSDS